MKDKKVAKSGKKVARFLPLFKIGKKVAKICQFRERLKFVFITIHFVFFYIKNMIYYHNNVYKIYKYLIYRIVYIVPFWRRFFFTKWWKGSKED